MMLLVYALLALKTQRFIITTSKTVAMGRVGKNVDKSMIIRGWSLK